MMGARSYVTLTAEQIDLSSNRVSRFHHVIWLFSQNLGLLDLAFAARNCVRLREQWIRSSSLVTRRFWTAA